MPQPVDFNCIFCKIVGGQIPCLKVFEDDTVLSFLDIGPLTRGHTLVIPKAHYATASDIPPELLSQVAARIPLIAKAVLAATGARAYHILANNGREAQQSVEHLHFHVLPRYAGSKFHVPWEAGKLDLAEGAAFAGKVREMLVE